MKLIDFQVQMFRNVIDSTSIAVCQSTCLVGKNEAGKSAILQALHALNPANPSGTFSVLDDYPRWLKKEHEISGELDKKMPIKATYKLSDDEIKVVEEWVGKGTLSSAEVEVSRQYGKDIQVTPKINLSKFIQHFCGFYSDSVIVSKMRSSGNSTDLMKMLTEMVAATPSGGDSGSVNEPEAARIALDGLKKILGSSNSVTQAITEWIKSKIPKTFYFSNYSQLRGRYLLSEVMAAVANKGEDEEIQAAADFLKLARVSNENLENWDFETSNSELEAISSLLSSRVRKHWKQNQHLKLSVKLEPVPKSGSTERYIQFRVEDTRHDFSSRLDRRSTGFRWFVSFMAAFFEFERETELILLFDEPGLSLHARAQMDLLNAIEMQLAGQRQVIYSTHSPFMVRPDSLHSARIVEDKGPDLGSVVSNDAGSVSDPDTIFPLQAALGYDVSQNLFIGSRNVLLEGISDLAYISVISSFLGKHKRSKIPENCRMLPVGGATNIATFVALLGKHLGVAIVLDGNSHRQRLDNSIKEGILQSKSVISLDFFSKVVGADIEDLFQPSEYVDMFNSALRQKVKLTSLKGEDRIVKRLERAIGGSFDHNAVASYFMENQISILPALSEETLHAFESLIKAIDGALPKQ